MVTTAPATIDPTGSVTVPVIDPVAWALAIPGRRIEHAKSTEVAKYLSFKFGSIVFRSFETIQNLMTKAIRPTKYLCQ
jgi:hypothetical protein